MDKEIMIEFAKTMGWGLFKIGVYVAVLYAVAHGFALAGATEPEAVIYAASAMLITLFTWFGVEAAYTGAKNRVEFKRKYGEDL